MTYSVNIYHATENNQPNSLFHEHVFTCLLLDLLSYQEICLIISLKGLVTVPVVLLIQALTTDQRPNPRLFIKPPFQFLTKCIQMDYECINEIL